MKTETMRNLLIVLIGFFITVLTVSMAAGAPQWTLDKTSSKLGFVVSVMNGERVGHFSDFDAEIAIAPDDLDTSSVRLEIDIASAKTGHGDIDKAMPSGAWFAVSDFPKASFASTAIRHVGGNSYEMDGKLKLRGIEKELTVPFTLDIEGDNAHAKGTVELNRSLFGVGQGEFSSGKAVGLEVNVVFELDAAKKN